MMKYTLKMFNTGQITLPKKWRSKYNTTHFVAEEGENGTLIISPLLETTETSSVYYEDDTGFGIHYPKGASPELLISEIEHIYK